MEREYSDFFSTSGFLFPDPDGEFWLGRGLEWQHSPVGAQLYSPDFFLRADRPWARARDLRKLTRGELIGQLRAVTFEQLPAPTWSAPDFDVFRSDFEALQGQIALGVLQKAVPVAFESTSEFSLSLLPGLLESVLRNSMNLPLHVYSVWSGDRGMLGATPELLFDYDGKKNLKAMALAGTRPHGDGRLALREDPKELREHDLVVTGILSSLKSLGRAQLGGLEELRLPTFSHLRTWVDVELSDGFDFETVTRALHPTPALGPYPREQGMSWLKEREEQPDRIDRGRFGAPFGIILPGGAARCLVAIRGFQWKGKEAWLGAGCGVIAESELDREWTELRHKRDSIKRLLGWEARV